MSQLGQTAGAGYWPHCGCSECDYIGAWDWGSPCLQCAHMNVVTQSVFRTLLYEGSSNTSGPLRWGYCHFDLTTFSYEFPGMNVVAVFLTLPPCWFGRVRVDSSTIKSNHDPSIFTPSTIWQAVRSAPQTLPPLGPLFWGSASLPVLWSSVPGKKCKFFCLYSPVLL